MNSPTTPHPSPQPDEPSRDASFLQVLGAVLSSFLGIRKKQAGERDIVTIKPLHIIIAGLIAAAIFVVTLMVLVMFITRKG